MRTDPAAIRFRLTATQMAVIWPGLDFIVKAHVSRREKKRAQYEYPFSLYPPPPGFDRGAYFAPMMEHIFALRNALLPKSTAGCRVQMNALQVRAAIFAVRVNLGMWRRRKHDGRRWNSDTKKRHGIDEDGLEQLRVKSQRALSSLERHMKRANRHLQTLVPPEEYAALMDAWKKHLRWMRLRLAYFKPLQPMTKGIKHACQIVLDELEGMAEHGIRCEGYQPPEAKELRRMMRLFVGSSRRGREGGYVDLSYLLKYAHTSSAKSYLANFVLRRMNLEPLPEL